MTMLIVCRADVAANMVPGVDCLCLLLRPFKFIFALLPAPVGVVVSTDLLPKCKVARVPRRLVRLIMATFAH